MKILLNMPIKKIIAFGSAKGGVGKSSITGASYPAGTYITFGTAVPTGKPVTVLHNFDK